ncbi:ttl domain-containing protein [Colletotrichum incanum]|uniref:Ttl domain-containing protein n=1 Tax=Colletotrichum incanum TaxID=1573173 RepID=A0A162Q7T4_COLIC|nr:ttl domain-containing protein [Colletotrichum incanum]OHW95281.1 TTL domain-containing protein [Colletotrichum incanum]
MHAYIHPACPWLSEHIKSCVRKHVPETKFIDDFDDFPTDSSEVFQFCDGLDMNRNFAVMSSAKMALINAYPNSDALARKDYLARVVELWTAKRPESILKDHVPVTIRLSLDYAEYVDEALIAADDLSLFYSLEENKDRPAPEREWWIMKPALVDCGAGIRLFSTMEELASHLELAKDEVSEDGESEMNAQYQEAMTKHASEPEKHKLNGHSPTPSTAGPDSLGGLIATTDAMSFKPPDSGFQRSTKPRYVFKEGGRVPSTQMREFVAQRYIVSVPPLENRKWHARSYALSMGRLKVYVFKEMLALLAGEDYEPPWLNPSLKSSLTNTALQDENVFTEKDSIRVFGGLPDGLLPGDWKTCVFDQICGITAELFRAAAHTMADKFITVNKCFELFAVDFLIDTNGNAWLLEVNETPAFYDVGVSSPLVLRLMDSVVCVALEHMDKARFDNEECIAAKARLVKVLDETDRLAKSNITEILPEK